MYPLENATIQKVLLQDAVKKLPEKEKVVIALRLIGYTQRECSEIIGGTRASIGSIYKRAMRKLTEELAES